MAEKPQEFRVRVKLKETKSAPPATQDADSPIEVRTNGKRVARSLADLAALTGITPQSSPETTKNNTRKSKQKESTAHAKEAASSISRERPIPTRKSSVEHTSVPHERPVPIADIARAAADELLDQKPRDVETHAREVAEGRALLHDYKETLSNREAMGREHDQANEENLKRDLKSHLEALRRLRTAAKETPKRREERKDHSKKLQEIRMRKRLAVSEDAYVENPERMRDRAEEAEYRAWKERLENTVRTDAPRETPRTQDNERPVAETLIETPSDTRIEPQEKHEQQLDGRYQSMVALRLSFFINNTRLASYVRRRTDLEKKLQHKDVELADLQLMRSELAKRFGVRDGKKSPEESEGLRGGYRISQKAWRSFDAEMEKITSHIARVEGDRTRLQQSLSETQEKEHTFRATCEDILARVSQRSESLVGPLESSLKELRDRREGVAHTLERCVGIAKRVEARIARNKALLRSSSFEAERVLLKDWIKKDELLYARVQESAGSDGTKLGARVWRERLRLLDIQTQNAQSKIESQRALLEGMRAQLHPPERVQAAQEVPIAAPVLRRESPATQQNETFPRRSVETDARKYSELWNRRFGSAFKIEAHTLQGLLPVDHEASEDEIEAALETHMLLRPRGIWRLPGLGWLHRAVTRRRVRSLRSLFKK